MKNTFLQMGLLVALFTPYSANAVFLLDHDEVDQKLCPQKICLRNWTKTDLLACNSAPPVSTPPPRDYVWGSYSDGHTVCVCPCNFVKFYPDHKTQPQARFYGN